MIVNIQAPEHSKLRPISWFPTAPGSVVAIVFALSSSANVVNGVIAVTLDWAVNTVIYWGMWEIVCVWMKKLKLTRKPTVL